MRGLWLLGAAAALLSPPALPLQAAQETAAARTSRLRIAILPFMERGTGPGAWAAARPALEEALRARHLEVADAARVAAALRQRRLRDTSLLTSAEMSDLGAELQVDRLLLGSVYRNDAAPEPAVSLLGRLVDPARAVIDGMAFAAVERRSFRQILGGGEDPTSARVIGEASSRLAASLLSGPRAGARVGAEEILQVSALAPAPNSFASPALAGRRLERVVVLPFRNQTPRPGAGQTASELVTWCLHAAAPLAVVEAGEASRRLLASGWRTGAPVSEGEVRTLGAGLEVDAVLMGTVERWESGGMGGAQPPRVALTLRLLDAADGGILWAAQHERRGDETRLFYEAGNVRLVEELAARAAFEALQTLLDALREGSRRPRREEGS
jgi:TolB-like protein